MRNGAGMTEEGDGVKEDPRGEGEEAHVKFNGTSKGEQRKVYTRF